MKKNILLILMLVSIFSCTTFYGPIPPVEYTFDKGLKKSTQWTMWKNKFDKYNEQEFFYDNKGNIIKVIYKDYFQGAGKDNKGKVIVYEATYKVIDDYAVPETFKCNDELVCEISYEKFQTTHKGNIELDIKARRGYRKEVTFINTLISSVSWNFDVDTMYAPFMEDDKFVNKDKNGNKYLEYGYNNILITRYFFSYENLIKGLNKTYKGAMCSSPYIGLVNTAALKNSQWDFKYEWKVIADKPCLLKIDVKSKYLDQKTDAEVVMTYNEKGFRTSEVWNVNFNNKKIEVFKQTLEY
ncbi:MAG TPA: hypothetical protein PLE45_07850 [Spirochaetota bacterium]|nr:hypothetical protein [Spirochaetota bacterium]HOL58111.1 hypothetical protein [Spirochaetota bacterium]HPP04710.1 hypothetical protein [Spirochaetota bacterium]